METVLTVVAIVAFGFWGLSNLLDAIDTLRIWRREDTGEGEEPATTISVTQLDTAAFNTFMANPENQNVILRVLNRARHNGRA